MMKLVKFDKDPVVIKICEGWCGNYDSSASESMGFENDDSATGYAAAVADFAASLKA